MPNAMLNVSCTPSPRSPKTTQESGHHCPHSTGQEPGGGGSPVFTAMAAVTAYTTCIWMASTENQDLQSGRLVG